MLQDQSVLRVVEWNCSTNVACNCCMLQSRIVYGGLNTPKVLKAHVTLALGLQY